MDNTYSVNKTFEVVTPILGRSEWPLILFMGSLFLGIVLVGVFSRSERNADGQRIDGSGKVVKPWIVVGQFVSVYLFVVLVAALFSPSTVDRDKYFRETMTQIEHSPSVDERVGEVDGIEGEATCTFSKDSDYGFRIFPESLIKKHDLINISCS